MPQYEFSIPSSLAANVQMIWGMESETSDEVFPRERVLPDGIVELVFHFGKPFFTHRANGTHYLQPRAFAISQMREFIELESSGPMGFLAVRFFPWGAHHFIHTPVSDFLDSYIKAESIWPGHLSEIESFCDASSEWDERVDRVSKFLELRAAETEVDPELDQAIRLIRRSAGMSIREFCDRYAWSEKQLQRKFLAAVGTSPKTFARVSRFLDLCGRMVEFRGKSLTELGEHCGYYDQSHFIREFRTFSGFTPKEFFQREDFGFADM